MEADGPLHRGRVFGQPLAPLRQRLGQREQGGEQARDLGVGKGLNETKDDGNCPNEPGLCGLGPNCLCRQRGICPEDAVNLIVSGFCKQVFRELPMEFAVEAQKLLGVSLEGSVG